MAYERTSWRFDVPVEAVGVEVELLAAYAIGFRSSPRRMNAAAGPVA